MGHHPGEPIARGWLLRPRQFIQLRGNGGGSGIAPTSGFCPNRVTAGNHRHPVAARPSRPVDGSVSGRIGIILKREDAEQSGQSRGDDFTGRTGVSSVPVLEIEDENANAGQVHVGAQPFGLEFKGLLVGARLAIQVRVKIAGSVELDKVVVRGRLRQNLRQGPRRELAERRDGKAPGKWNDRVSDPNFWRTGGHDSRGRAP